jgi:hypothetical protein
MHGILKLRKLIQQDPEAGWRKRYGAEGTEELAPESPEHPAAENVSPPGDTAGA